MIIRTQRRDFYDHFQHIYGQDKNIVWDTDVITRDEELLFNGREPHPGRSLFHAIIPLEKMGMPDFRPDVPEALSRFDLRCVSVIGYPTVLNKGESLTEKTLEKLWKDERRGGGLHWLAKPLWESMEKFQSGENRDILSVHRLLNAPIMRFRIDQHGHMEIYNEVPILSEIPGFVKKVRDPGRFYQKLYNFFIENRDKSDLEPPVMLGNKSKIQKAGFDAKISFRHPVR